MSKKSRTNRHYFADKPITYYPVIEEEYDNWAEACGRDPEYLRQATEKAIRTRHHEAIIMFESHKAHGNQPDIFTLSLGSVDVIYTVEPSEVMIRGYCGDVEGEPLDDVSGGAFYVDALWLRDSRHVLMTSTTCNQANTLVISQELLDAVRQVVNYLWDDERRHFEEGGADNPNGHIFASLRRIKIWLDRYVPDNACMVK